VLERRGAIDVEAVEQVAPVERQHPFRVPGPRRTDELDRIAPEERVIHPDLAGAARDQRAVSERPAQEVERVAQRPPRPVDVGLRPEHGQERVAPPELPGRADGEIGEQRRASGLREHGAGAGLVAAPQIQGAQDAELGRGGRHGAGGNARRRAS
jgi:hypothetical protein